MQTGYCDTLCAHFDLSQLPKGHRAADKTGCTGRRCVFGERISHPVDEGNPARRGINSVDPSYENTWSSNMVEELGETGVREFLRCYYASVKLIDDQVGRVLQELELEDKLENTIIVFTADHGDMMGGHKMVWKSNHSFYDEVVRIPMIISYPKHIAPDKAAFPINLVDLPVTLLGLVNQKIPEHMTGNDLSPFITGDKDHSEAPAYVLCSRLQAHPEHKRNVEAGRPGNFMIRGKGWKYVLYHNGKEFLYNLIDDPEELNNLSSDPDFQDKKEELNNELIKLLEKTHYKF